MFDFSDKASTAVEATSTLTTDQVADTCIELGHSSPSSSHDQPVSMTSRDEAAHNEAIGSDHDIDSAERGDHSEGIVPQPEGTMAPDPEMVAREVPPIAWVEGVTSGADADALEGGKGGDVVATPDDEEAAGVAQAGPDNGALKGGEGGKVGSTDTPLPPSSAPVPGGDAAKCEVGDDIYMPAPRVNPVVRVLKEKGLYLAEDGPGRHRLRCPFAGGASEAVYLEPSDGMPQGSFVSPLPDRRVGHLLKALEVDAGVARCKSRIRLKKGETHRIVAAAEKVLAARGDFYASNGQIVRLVLDPATQEPSLTPTDEQTLLIELSAGADWFKYDGKDWTRCDVPTNIVTALSKARDYRLLPKLTGLARQPYLGKSDRRLVTATGFDRESGVYAGFDPAAFSIPEPSRAAAQEALERLKALLAEFEFAQPSDRSTALCAMLTATIRDHLPVAPAFNITASSPGSGKSYLANLIAPFASSAEPRNISYPSSGEEATKVVLSLALEQPAVVLFDDMAGDWVPHGALNRMLTSGSVAERKLGTNQVVTAWTCSFVMGTGNNIRPLRDMARRVASIYLLPQREAVATREYHGKPLQQVRANRGAYVSDALTIITAWLIGDRALHNITNVAGFDDWSYLCRQPLIWLGEPDPAESLIEQITHDPDTEQLGELLQAWSDTFGSRAMTVRKVIAKAEGDKDGELFGTIRELPCTNGAYISGMKFGRHLARNRNRIVNGLKLVDAPNTERKAWAVVRVTTPTIDRSPLPEADIPTPWVNTDPGEQRSPIDDIFVNA